MIADGDAPMVALALPMLSPDVEVAKRLSHMQLSVARLLLHIGARSFSCPLQSMLTSCTCLHHSLRATLHNAILHDAAIAVLLVRYEQALFIYRSSREYNFICLHVQIPVNYVCAGHTGRSQSSHCGHFPCLQLQLLEQIPVHVFKATLCPCSCPLSSAGVISNGEPSPPM